MRATNEHACSQALEDIITDMDRRPSAEALMALGVVGELFALESEGSPLTPFQERLAGAVSKWVKSGLFEDMMATSAQTVYHASLLAALCTRHVELPADRVSHLERLFQAGLLSRAEYPLLTLAAIRSNFTILGIAGSEPHTLIDGETLSIDRRLLRPRMDEYDVTAYFVIARLAQENPDRTDLRPRYFLSVMLVQALRDSDASWVAIITYLLMRLQSGSPQLRSMAINWLLNDLPPSAGLLPLPHEGAAPSEFSRKAPLGLRLRNSLAMLALQSETTQ